MSKVISYFSQVWEELSKVTWPTRAEAIKMTLTVLIASVIIAIFIGGLDLVLTKFIGKVLSL
ncbi:MAG: preprotein translocase subunit SecE [Candidatus Woykebacteria bacterium RBG_16_43_9]|uniref:Protein translocase subunit SecE n=1 Tax=Candidatus Woykebacteria bacterium RBG_16_43_9 TaxID=1802596 RepID=A0A1G1WEC9_9BACT|nr:MAG: preprotein translocase subunit SecE [Candidatus Woykebacteria bacterium RBG_16_43_9]